MMSAIDFEKAFVSVSLDFLFKSLELFGFGVSFISWIKTNNVFFLLHLSTLNKEFVRATHSHHPSLS